MDLCNCYTAGLLLEVDFCIYDIWHDVCLGMCLEWELQFSVKLSSWDKYPCRQNLLLSVNEHLSGLMMFHPWQCKMRGKEREPQMTDSSEHTLSSRWQSKFLGGIYAFCNWLLYPFWGVLEGCQNNKQAENQNNAANETFNIKFWASLQYSQWQFLPYTTTEEKDLAPFIFRVT